MNPTFPLTRTDALNRLNAFASKAGVAYRNQRNYDFGSQRHESVSRLSAALRRRIITEAEVCRVILDTHNYKDAEQFIAEICWRTYWKGWLEHHPTLWTRYQSELSSCQMMHQQQADFREAYKTAISGKTGIDCFDHWTQELLETGYLHNWARMQWASIWIFTLGLPWQMGADFTYRHFRDADPASNTLSWRWVAGLHTAGKHYLADPEKIRTLTQGRFTPTGLNTAATAISEATKPTQSPPRQPMPFNASLPSALLITPEDLSLENEGSLAEMEIGLILAPSTLFPTLADRRAGEDALQRAAAHWRCEAGWVDDLAGVQPAMKKHQLDQCLTGFLPVGDTRDAVMCWASKLTAEGITLGEVQRQWDLVLWPYCQKGFFHLKSRIPQLLAQMGIE
ncbi:deoxyribodipyrimidine photolyase [Novosphingobium umbonatum]|uniref:Deoxyribodipyrimidine photolyase n=1 Tax=Novosphingobium umbonatum TaxID=1908524 RepID=A0A3S2Y4M6_9SPHN|nr:FAD-binding domain-containing protein [Novosphingobium umbonatum]RVU03364.1 deoxyribodipyrimidine photolyase [Novosphingobium umbonatum]